MSQERPRNARAHCGPCASRVGRHQRDLTHSAAQMQLQLDNTVLTDRFEWDLAAPDNCPETFAHALCAELGIGGAFVPTVAHCLRERLSWYSHSLASGDAAAVLRPLQPGESPFRDPATADRWTPTLHTMSGAEVAKAIQSEERGARYAAPCAPHVRPIR